MFPPLGLHSAWGAANERELTAAREQRRQRMLTLVRRSILIVPVNVPRFVEKAHQRGADAILLDLEDSIPPAEKAHARTLVKDLIPVVGRGGADVMVRINKPFELAVRDLDAVVWPGLAAIHLPKCESADEAMILDRLIHERELARDLPPGGIQLGLALESARGLLDAPQIATASDRVYEIHFGSEDVTLELGVEPTPQGKERLYGNLYVVMVAAMAGVQTHGRLANVADFSDLETFESSCREAYNLGFKGSSCIHPAQVPIINRAFTPPEDLVTWSRRVIETLDAAQAEGRSSAALDGKMVDIPTAERARQLLVRADAIAAKDAQKRKLTGTS
ncbi:MAG: CoA ester lyase [Chloroflexi bacterium]|nr:CoA ester lyase [Chloroflexota bacterium]